jgi:ATP-dependent RNA helicase DHX57
MENNAWSRARSSVLDAAVKDLKEVGAIRREAKGEWELTELGGHLARMPVDTRLARMLVFAAVFGCVEPALTIAATMSARSPFVAPFDQRDAANKAKESFAKDKDRSDHILYVRVYEAWCDVKGRGGAAERAWCRENFLSSVGLRFV